MDSCATRYGLFAETYAACGRVIEIVEDGALAPVLAQGRPVHLETTNPRNLAFYERAGFEQRAQLRLGADGPVIRALSCQPE